MTPEVGALVKESKQNTERQGDPARIHTIAAVSRIHARHIRVRSIFPFSQAPFSLVTPTTKGNVDLIADATSKSLKDQRCHASNRSNNSRLKERTAHQQIPRGPAQRGPGRTAVHSKHCPCGSRSRPQQASALILGISILGPPLPFRRPRDLVPPSTPSRSVAFLWTFQPRKMRKNDERNGQTTNFTGREN